MESYEVTPGVTCEECGSHAYDQTGPSRLRPSSNVGLYNTPRWVLEALPCELCY
jgi:hypothetical protein